MLWAFVSTCLVFSNSDRRRWPFYGARQGVVEADAVLGGRDWRRYHHRKSTTLCLISGYRLHLLPDATQPVRWWAYILLGRGRSWRPTSFRGMMRIRAGTLPRLTRRQRRKPYHRRRWRRRPLTGRVAPIPTLPNDEDPGWSVAPTNTPSAQETIPAPPTATPPPQETVAPTGRASAGIGGPRRAGHRRRRRRRSNGHAQHRAGTDLAATGRDDYADGDTDQYAGADADHRADYLTRRVSAQMTSTTRRGCTGAICTTRTVIRFVHSTTATNRQTKATRAGCF